MYAPGDVRVEERGEPRIVKPTDAILRLSATCICGSDLWPYRGIDTPAGPLRRGDEYAGIVEEIGSEVSLIKPGQFVVGSFFASDNTCEICRAGYQSSCVHRVGMGQEGSQAERLRVPLADGTLVATPDVPADDLVPSLLAASDVLGTGWFGAVAAEAGGEDRRRGGRWRRRVARRHGGAPPRRGSDHRDEPARVSSGTRLEVRRDRHRRGARRRGRRRNQGPHERARCALRDRSGGHAGVDDASD